MNTFKISERNNRIILDEKTHIYTIKGLNFTPTSVTQWVHSHFEPFNSDEIIAKMISSSNWKTSKYYGMSEAQIKDLWEKNRIDAATKGTKLHYDIECFYKNKEVKNDTKEYKYFKAFYKNHKHLIPFEIEWKIFDEELKIAGSVDMTFINKDDNTISIYDWKRSKEIKTENFWRKALTREIQHIPDTNFWHYALQLNTYKVIIERKYNMKVKDMYIVVFHPDNKNYRKYKIPEMDYEMDLLFFEEN